MSGPANRFTLGALLAVVLVVCLLAAFGIGAVVGEYRPHLARPFSNWAFPLVLLLREPECNVDDVTRCGLSHADREAVSCAPFTTANPRHAVLLAFGQSNSSNYGETRYSAGNKVANFNLHDGKCYRAEDPLLGADGTGGSVWGRLGDELVASGAFDQVLVVSFGIGATTLGEWTTGGRLHPRVEYAARQLAAANIEATHVLWHQGEDDVRKGTSSEDYIAMFAALVASLRGYGIEAPVFPAVATICEDLGSDTLRAAQRALPRRINGVYPGADTDSLSDMSDRHDFCHFSDQGMARHAGLWQSSILAYESGGG